MWSVWPPLGWGNFATQQYISSIKKQFMKNYFRTLILLGGGLVLSYLSWHKPDRWFDDAKRIDAFYSNYEYDNWALWREKLVEIMDYRKGTTKNSICNGRVWNSKNGWNGRYVGLPTWGAKLHYSKWVKFAGTQWNPKSYAGLKYQKLNQKGEKTGRYGRLFSSQFLITLRLPTYVLVSELCNCLARLDRVWMGLMWFYLRSNARLSERFIQRLSAIFTTNKEVKHIHLGWCASAWTYEVVIGNGFIGKSLRVNELQVVIYFWGWTSEPYNSPAYNKAKWSMWVIAQYFFKKPKGLVW